MNRRTYLASAIAMTILAGAAITSAATNVLSSKAESATEQPASPVAAETATVQKGDLSSERQFKATVSFGDQWTITTAAAGTITQQHPVGTTVDFGEALLRIGDKPLFLGEGEMPMFRTLSKVDTGTRDENGKRVELLSGPDVAQLQWFLRKAGFDADDRLAVDGIFGAITETAVKAWQESVGLQATGQVNNSQLVFAPGPVRIADESQLGATFAELKVTNATSAVLVDTSNRDRASLPIGGEVAVELPDGSLSSGTVSSQEQATASDGTAVWRTTVAVDGELPGSASTATVTVTEVAAQGVLLVPVGALLALAEGGFAVEIPGDTTTTLVRVEVGEVLDGRAEISGNITEGDQIVIPA